MTMTVERIVDEADIADTTMQLNPDRSITIRLRAGSPAESVVLPQPSMEELVTIRELFKAADDVLPEVPILNPDAKQRTIQEIEHYTDIIEERADIIYGRESPHGKAIIEAIRILTGEQYTFAHLLGGAMNPQTLRKVLRHWQAPLGGVDNLLS